MNVLIIGSGGREHAMAWKAAQSKQLKKMYCAPGNPGMAAVGECVDISPDDQTALVNFARDKSIDLVLVGPETPLAAGLADVFRQAGIKVFGPSRLAAEIESSKAYAKQFMARWDIPTARFAIFTQLDQATAYLDTLDYPVVIKASGLAAGKGVLLPATREEAHACLRQVMVEGEFGSAGDEVVIEERLEGPEVSLLAFTDGVTVRAMPPAQDHKRQLDGDRGPNTGGMGAYAPAPVCPPELAAEIVRSVLQPAVDGLRAEGRTYIGVIYAGMMLTSAGPRTLEFNCRFGDPETQAMLPLLESDLVEIALACVEGRLDEIDIRWSKGSAACVVLASSGYPGRYETGKVIGGIETLPPGTTVFHAGTRMAGGELVTAGGRVLAAAGWAPTLKTALDKAYHAVRHVRFEGMQYRSDIGWRALRGDAAPVSSAYAQAGVNIDAGNRAVRLMSPAVKATYTENVLAGIGAFGGLFAAEFLKDFNHPVLVASTDGVGTKVKLAAAVGRYETIGHDIVNHCINDILVQGARPLFFLDYFATSDLKPEVVAQVVTGIAAACRAAGCALLGGETAEMPGVYVPGEFDVAGTIVGVVDRQSILPRGDLHAGDVLVGLRSSGPHTNGFSLLRKVFDGAALSQGMPGLEGSLADALLAPHRSYFQLLWPILQEQPGLVKALAHLTGGGFIENIPRILPDGLAARLRRGSWPVPPLFGLAQARGQIDADEMLRVFNMGVGMVAIVDRADADRFQTQLGEESWIIGDLAAGERKVVLE
jgi:phosphoribosylamine--glycine ligase / phosphoribosylformylglycinamidine cyclo-ligase